MRLMSDSDSDTGAPVRKTRTKLACNGCKKRRRKCDGDQPCTTCAKAGAKCEYDIENRRKPASKKYVSTLLQQIDSLKSVISNRVLLTNQLSVDSSVMKTLKTHKFEIKHIVNHDAFKLDQDATGHITYHGPTTFRHMSEPPTVHVAPGRTAVVLEREIHLKSFDWFFQHFNRSLPLVDEALFYASIYDSSGKPNRFVSASLVSAITAVSFSRIQNAAYASYKEAAAREVMSEIAHINITQVQTLVLLAVLEMTDGNEAVSSCHMSMAAALSSHLGLHLDCDTLSVSREEKRLRQRVFWCCFIVDRCRYPVLGTGPFLESCDISVRLAVDSASDPLLFIRELAILLDILTISFQNIYSLKFQLGLKEKNRERQLAALKDAEVVLSQWNRELPPICRLRNESALPSDVSQVNFLHLVHEMGTALITKPFATDPTKVDHFKSQHSVEKMVRLISCIEKSEINKSPLAFMALFGLYMASIICLFHYFDKNKRKAAGDAFRKCVDLFKAHAAVFPVANVYLERIKVVKEDWKVPVALEEVPTDEDIFKDANWTQEFEIFDAESMMDSMKFYEIFGGIFPN